MFEIIRCSVSQTGTYFYLGANLYRKQSYIKIIFNILYLYIQLGKPIIC